MRSLCLSLLLTLLGAEVHAFKGKIGGETVEVLNKLPEGKVPISSDNPAIKSLLIYLGKKGCYKCKVNGCNFEGQGAVFHVVSQHLSGGRVRISKRAATYFVDPVKVKQVAEDHDVQLPALGRPRKIRPQKDEDACVALANKAQAAADLTTRLKRSIKSTLIDAAKRAELERNLKSAQRKSKTLLQFMPLDYASLAHRHVKGIIVKTFKGLYCKRCKELVAGWATHASGHFSALRYKVGKTFWFCVKKDRIKAFKNLKEPFIPALSPEESLDPFLKAALKAQQEANSIEHANEKRRLPPDARKDDFLVGDNLHKINHLKEE